LLNNLIKIAFLAALPVTELRGAIPVGLSFYNLPVLPTYIVAVLGNIIPALFLLKYLKPFSEFLRRWLIFEMFFSWLFRRTGKYEKKYEKYGVIFLFFFIAIPLPGTGIWTGSVAAFLFGIRFWYAFSTMAAGVACAGIIVTLTNLGLLSIFV